MCGLRISGDNQWQCGVAGGYLVDRRLQRSYPVVHQWLPIDPVAPLLVHQHFHLLLDDLPRLTIGFGQVQRELRFPRERGGHHEEDQQQEYHVDQGRKVYPHFCGLLAAEFQVRSSRRSSLCRASMSLIVSCSRPTTMASIRPTK